MKPFLLLLVALLRCFFSTSAQQPLCLAIDAATGHVDFRPDALAAFLHLDRYRIVLFGEQHNVRFDPEVRYHLITDLNRRLGIRHVFLEMSVSGAWNYNQYLRTGDTALYLSHPGWPRLDSAYFQLWERLYAYNQTLPEDRRIVVHGVDFEATSVFETLLRLAPTGQPVPAELQPILDTIRAHRADPPLHMWDRTGGKFILYDNKGFEQTLRAIQNGLQAHQAAAEGYYGANYPVVRAIAANRGRVEVRAARRDKTMLEAIRRITREQHIDAFVGFFGGQHTSYAMSGSLSRGVRKLPGVRASDVLHITEFAYNPQATDTAFRRKEHAALVALNGACLASVYPAAAVPGFRKAADFVVLVNIGE